MRFDRVMQSLLPPRDSRARFAAIIFMTAAPFAIGVLAFALGQDANWDLRNYHWYNAFAFVNERYGRDFLPSQTPYFYNPLLDLPFFMLATHAPAKLAGFALGFVQGFNIILLFLLAQASLVIRRPWRKFTVSALLATLGMLGGGGIAQIGTTFYDNVTSLGVFLSALLIITQYQRLMTTRLPKSVLLSVLCGLPCGLMMGLKLPSVVFCVGFCFAILVMGNSWRRQFIASFGFGIGVLIGAAITLGHWAWFLNNYYGNPFFPYFNDIFKSPLAPEVSARDTKFIPSGFWDILTFPFRFNRIDVAGEIPWRDWRIPILYVLLPIGIIARLVELARHKKAADRGFVQAPAMRYLLAAGVISYAVWLHMFSIYRYAIPLEMLAPLLIVLTTSLLPITKKQCAGLSFVLLLMAAVSIQPGNWGRHQGWLDRFVEAAVPPIEEPENTILLMAGYEPYSHILTEFPNKMRFVRVQSNFASPEEQKGINRLILQRIKWHSGKFLLLIPPHQMELAVPALAGYGLTFDATSCQTVTDRLYENSLLSLCPVKRLKKMIQNND